MRQKSSCLLYPCQKKTWAWISSSGSMRNIRLGKFQGWSEISDKVNKLKAMAGFGIKIKLSHVAKTHRYTGTRIRFPCTFPDRNYKKKKPHSENPFFHTMWLGHIIRAHFSRTSTAPFSLQTLSNKTKFI